ncbi:MAG: aromatic amino acid transport family protein, partial [Patescibacteria group bacterium]
KFDSNFFYALSVLIGAIVGVGIFALPYAVNQVGFIGGLIFFSLLVIFIVFYHLIFGEIILRTKGEHRLLGYTKIYLNPFFKHLISFSTVVSFFCILAVYLLIGGQFLQSIFSSSSLTLDNYIIIFWIFSSILVVCGLKTFAKIELIVDIFLILIIGALFIFTFPELKFNNISNFEPNNLFLAYGTIFFALMGASAIPDVRSILKNKEKKTFWVIISGTIIAALIYLIFIFVITGLSGNNVEKLATENMKNIFPGQFSLWMYLLGLILVLTSYMESSHFLRESFLYDFNLNKFFGIFVIIFIPIFLILLGVNDFSKIIALVGSIFGSIDAIVLLLIYLKAKKFGNREPEYSLKISNPLIYFFILILSVGFLSSFWI